MTAMYIQKVSIRYFGGIRLYRADFSPELNFINSRYTDEIRVAMAYLLCNKERPVLPKHWVQENTMISATIYLEGICYEVCVTPVSGGVKRFVTDATGADATERYRYALSHCAEQDDIESFDGLDKTLPLRFSRYCSREYGIRLSQKTERLTDTKTFRRYLYQYLHSFQPEPINCQKRYHAELDLQGEFQVVHPEISGKVNLSETEQRLFRYICFLNLAEFWAGFENIRDMHYEKKPLLIRNFYEFLDESVNIKNLITRTRKLNRQVMMLCNTGKEINNDFLVRSKGNPASVPTEKRI